MFTSAVRIIAVLQTYCLACFRCQFWPCACYFSIISAL